MSVRKRIQVLAVILVLSALLIATAVYATTQLIKAQRGGVIYVDDGIQFKVPPGALEADTIISVDMIKTKDRIRFKFGPDGTTFDPPAQLIITWSAIDELGVCDLTLYAEDGSGIKPNIGSSLKYDIPHFSLYYLARR